MNRIHPAIALVGVSAIVLAVLIGILAWPSLFGDRPTGTLVVHVAAGLRGPMEEIAADYERETGRRIEMNFDGSAPILARIDQSRIGDVFLPADESYIDIAKGKELVREQDVTAISRMRAVLIVPAQNVGKIQSWNDLMRDGTKFALADPDRAAIGKLTREHLQRTGKWEQLKKRITVTNATVTETANVVAVPAVDAGIVWDVVARPIPKLKMLDLPELAGIEAKVSAAVLTCSKQPAEAQQFVRYIAAADKGLLRFRGHGLSRIESGDPFALKPKLVLYAGAMLRPAIEETVKKFEAREGVRIECSYSGCGILVSQMTAGQHPDLFVACDARFMSDAQQSAGFGWEWKEK